MSECVVGDLTTLLTKNMTVCGVADNTLHEHLLHDGTNHFEACCPEKEVNSVAEKNNPIPSSSSDDDDDDEFYIDMVTSTSSSSITSNSSTNSFTQAGSASSEASVFTVNDTESDWSVTLEINGADVAFKIDTGA